MRPQSAQSFSVALTSFLAEQLFSSTKSQNCVIELGTDIGVDNETSSGAHSDGATKSFYWGGSALQDHLPSDERLETMEILAVRGPVTAAALDLPSTIPQGDITLFLPALYTPQADALTEGKTAFIPHENDKRKDSAFADTGCDVVLRPVVSKSRTSLFELIDAIVAAKFVLTSSLTAAMVAAAYGRPFALWDDDQNLDKTDWEDFTKLMGLPLVRAKTIKSAQAAYIKAAASIAPITHKAFLSPFLATAPYPIRPEGLLKILDHIIRNGGHNSAGHTIETMVRNFARHQSELEILTRTGADSPDAAQGATSDREQDLQARVQSLEEKNRDAELREKNLLHSLHLLGGKISETHVVPAPGKKLPANPKAAIAALQRQLHAEMSRVEMLQQDLEASRNAAQFEASFAQRKLAEVEASLADARERYQRIHNSRTWSLVRKSRALRQALSPRKLLKKGRKSLRKLFGRTPANQHAVEVTPQHSGDPSELAIVISDIGSNVSAEARNRIKGWIAHGYNVTVCGHSRDWRKLGALVVKSDAAKIVSAVNATVRNSRSAFVLVLTTPENDINGLEFIKPGFVNFDQLAIVCAVETREGKVHAAGGVFEDANVVPLHNGLKAGASSVTRIMPTQALWPTAVALDQDSFVHLGTLPAAPTLEAALIAYGAKVRARGLEMAVNGLLTTEQPHPKDKIAVDHNLIDALGTKPLKERPWVLFTDGHTPTPDKDSGSIDLYWFLRIFREMGYQIAFMPYHHREHAGRYTDDLRLLGIETVQGSDYAEPWQHIREHGRRYELALVYRVTTAAYIIEPIRTFAPKTKIVFDTVDLHFLREEMAAKQTGSKLDMDQAQATRVQELIAMEKADATILLSASEDALIAKIRPKIKRKLISIVRPVPGRTRGAKGRRDAIFVGGFNHSPNLDAALFLCRDIWPHVRRLDPTISVNIIGADAPEQILELHNPAQGLNVIGRVPTLDEYYDKARINLAPLTFGAGVKGKVAASLSVGLPTVGTTVATDGMWLTDGKDVLVADKPEAFAKKIVKLHQDDKLWDTLSVNGIKTARQHFSIDAARKQLHALLDDLGIKPPAQ